jgi:signal transduction histidine kinase
MSELQESPEDRKSPGTGAGSPSSNGRFEVSPSSSHLDDFIARGQRLQSLRTGRELKNDFPRWLRPFFSLRVQLTLVYGMVLALVAVAMFLLIAPKIEPTYIVLAEVGTVIVGMVVAFIFTSLLLRPLGRVTDAAQAIAIGDLQQRARLPLRLPPQDEVDRLAGSLHEMVTRLEYAEEMQRAAEERTQRFFVDASHQLRTPLTSIGGFTQVLMRGAKDDPETAQRILLLMKSEVERMTRLIKDLLTLARLDDRRSAKAQYLDLTALVADGIAHARKQAKDERAISLVLETRDAIGLQGDKDGIKQLLFILLDNAVKHGRPAPNGEVTLRLDKQNEQAVIRVIDNGEGIASEDLEHIFEAFYRGRGHYKRTASSNGLVVGEGLGLTIAAAIVRAHHGTITACSDPGVGTEFRVTLPTRS